MNGNTTSGKGGGLKDYRHLIRVICSALLAILFVFASQMIKGQSIDRLELGARIDFKQRWTDGVHSPDGSGFEGQYVRFRIDGTIMPDVAFVYRQRFNKANNGTTFFDTIDFLKVVYSHGPWVWTFGKDDVYLGNYENDRAAYDVYFFSDVWRQFANKQFGASVGLRLGPRGDMLELQFDQSPFCRSQYNTSERADMYGYNIRYKMSRGAYHGMYSVNFFEYLPGCYINYLCLGNKLQTQRLTIELDLVNRATRGQRFLLQDFSVVANAVVRCSDCVNLTAKYSYDRNNTSNTTDFYVMRGTSLHMVSGGLEIFPLKSRDLRVHALAGYFFGRSPDLSFHHDKELNFLAGCTWIIDFQKMMRGRANAQ